MALGLFPYLLYIYFLDEINLFFVEILHVDSKQQTDAYLAWRKAFDLLRRLIFNEGLILFSVWCIYEKHYALKYLRFSLLYVCLVMVFKGMAYFTASDFIQKIAYSLGLLGSNIEWFLLILSAFYMLKNRSKNANL